MTTETFEQRRQRIEKTINTSLDYCPCGKLREALALIRDELVELIARSEPKPCTTMAAEKTQADEYDQWLRENGHGFLSKEQLTELERRFDALRAAVFAECEKIAREAGDKCSSGTCLGVADAIKARGTKP